MIYWLVLLVIVKFFSRCSRNKESIMRELEVAQGRWIQEGWVAQLGLQFFEVGQELREGGKFGQKTRKEWAAQGLGKIAIVLFLVFFEPLFLLFSLLGQLLFQTRISVAVLHHLYFYE